MNPELIEKLNGLLKVQGTDGNWNHDNYMCGMFNGMELMLSIIENREVNYKSPSDAKKEVIKMNVKEKLIKQLGALENLQLLAINANEFGTALSVSGMMLDYIRNIEATQTQEESDCVKDYICHDCEEAIAKEILHQEIADTCDMPIEIVKRVLAGQEEVLNGD